MTKNRYNQGYTLVEAIVALGIFVLISALATGAFISILSAQKKTLASQSASQQLRYFQDVISRDIRAAKLVTCNNPSADSTKLVINRDATGDSQTTYEWDQNTHKITQLSTESGTPADNASSIVDVNVTRFAAYCHDIGSGKSYVTISISVAGVAQPFQVSIMPRMGEAQ